MKRNGKKLFYTGITLIGLFALWTLLIQTVDVQSAGPAASKIGFAKLNIRFHQRTGVHMGLYTLTDWLGLVPVAVCAGFALVGLGQWIRRKRLRNVDLDILLLGIYYLTVIACYLFFEAVPINFRPVLIEGRLETSYPSSTTLLVCCIMPTLTFQVNRRSNRTGITALTAVAANLFSLFTVIGRLLSGVHWLTDIIGSVLLSGGLFCLYRAAVLLKGYEKDTQEVSKWNFAKNFRNCENTAD